MCYKIKLRQALWCTPIIPAPGRLRQEDPELKARLGYIARLVSNKLEKIKEGVCVCVCVCVYVRERERSTGGERTDF
jgi:hypothetical protein